MKMRYGIIKGMKAVRAAVNEYILIENVEGGILEDVVDIITTQRVENPVQPPFIWIYKLPTDADEEPKSRTQLFKTGYQILCGCYDDDIGVAEELTENLTHRAVACIQKNFNSKNIPYFENRDYEKIFTNVRISTIYPVGDVPIRGKSDRVPVSAFNVYFKHRIDWSHCNMNIELDE